MNTKPLATNTGQQRHQPPLSIVKPGDRLPGDPCPTIGQSGILYRSRQMHELVNKAIRFARTTATVLVTGENGTGKELVARLIHDFSPRSAERFVRINCAALSESLVESELFGHEKGAFTGADQMRQGRFEWARGGSLLLDEISEIGVAAQVKLLRALEENEIQRVGSNDTIRTDVRIIATSNQELAEQIAKGEFREDLYYRLNVLRIQVPPLRDRAEDIPFLANHFVRQFASEAPSSPTRFSKAALAALCQYTWPGNIRQLKNVVLSAAIMAGSSTIEVDDLPDLDPPLRASRLPAWMFETSLAEIERRVIVESLSRLNGNKTLVARILGVTTRTLTNKVNRYRQDGLGLAPGE